MVKKLHMILVIAAILSTPFVFASRVAAFDTLEQTCDGTSTSEKSTVCQDKKTVTDPVTGSDAIVPKVANIMALVGGIIAVVIIMINGLKLMTSVGDSSKLTETRNAIIYASVGLVIIVTARIIFSYITRIL